MTEKSQIKQKKEIQLFKQKQFKYGDPVIVQDEKANQLKLIQLKENGAFQNNIGHYKHSEFIGKVSGSTIIGPKKNGSIQIFEPTQILLTDTIPHKTQILYQQDIAMIIMKLNIQPGMKIVESGTGSGSLSISIATAIQETGQLYTFEFSEDRVNNAQQQFKNLQFNNVTVIWRDSCQFGFMPQANDKITYQINKNINAVFLDLPKPWEAIKHAKEVLCQGGRICCFSPCIEQVQKNCDELIEQGFVDLETIESLSRNLIPHSKTILNYELNDQVDNEIKKDDEVATDEQNKQKQSQKIQQQQEIDDDQDYDNKNENADDNENDNDNNQNMLGKRNFEKLNNNNSQKKYFFKWTSKKVTYFSSGNTTQKGHTGFLTFAFLP